MKSEIKKLKEQLWQSCRTIVKANYGPTCYTCGKTPLIGGSYQIGHMIPKKIAHHLQFDIRILRPQCFFCNINMGGNGAKFVWNVIQEKGILHVQEIFNDYNTIVKADLKYWENKLLQTKQLISTMITICQYCKTILDKHGIEDNVSHGLCESCYKQLMEGLKNGNYNEVHLRLLAANKPN